MKRIIARFAVLVFFLLLIISGVWAYFFRDILLRTGLPETKVYSSIFLVGGFVFAIIIVLLIITVLLELIFSENFRSEFIHLLRQTSRLRNSPPGTRIHPASDPELNSLTGEVNGLVAKLEGEISKDIQTAQSEHQQFVLEQNRLTFEQKKIYEEKEKLNYVLAGVKDGVILLSQARKIVLTNKAAEELTGFTQAEAVGKIIDSAVKFFDESREVSVAEYAPTAATVALKDQTFIKKRVRLQSSQATPKYVDLICVRLTLIQAQDLGYMLVLHDLTARIEIEKKRTQLLQSFANDLRAPFNLISTNLQSNTSDLSGVHAGASQLSLIMENLDIAGAVEEGSLPLSVVGVDLLATLQTAVSIVRPAAVSGQISLQAIQPKDMPLTVNADPSRLLQVILNLLFNAIAYTLPGGTITVSFSSTDTDIMLQIQDTGIGIPTEAMKDLFTRFFTFPNNKGIPTGTGLGLYISKKLIESQNGRIWLDSVEGRGTVATISLPKQ